MKNKVLTVKKIILMLFIFLPLAFADVYAAPEPATAQPAGPIVALSELEIRLIPLYKSDLVDVADYWLSILQEHLEKISALRIEIAKADGEQKAQLLEVLNRQREIKTQLIDRVNAVLAELQKKGGDVTEYQSYVNAVSGAQIETNDANAVVSSIKGWLQSPEGGLRWGKNIILFFVTLIIFWILAGFLGRVTGRAVNGMKRASDLLKHFLVNMVTNLTKVIGLMVALSMLEVNIGPLVAALGAAGFIVGFALQGTLSNFAAGVMILIYRPFDLGDVVNVAGTIGTVTSMTLVSTTLKLPDNQVVVIPNNSIWGSTITNITGSETRRVDMVFGIGYDDDIAKAESVLADILHKHPLILDDPEPVVKVHELADSSVNFVVRPWAKTADYFTVYWDINRAVKDRFDAEGISIPYPQRDVHLHNAPS